MVLKYWYKRGFIKYQPRLNTRRNVDRVKCMDRYMRNKIRKKDNLEYKQYYT